MASLAVQLDPVDDLARVIDFVEVTPALRGTSENASSNPQRQRRSAALVRKSLGVRVGPPLMRWVLELHGAIMIKTETELVLKSQVGGAALVAAGFAFDYPDLEPALRQILDPATSRAEIGPSQDGRQDLTPSHRITLNHRGDGWLGRHRRGGGSHAQRARSPCSLRRPLASKTALLAEETGAEPFVADFARLEDVRRLASRSTRGWITAH